MHGDEVIAQLRSAHGCNDDCFLCREEQDHYKIPKLARWNHFVSSNAAMRIAFAVIENKVTMPVISADPLEQYLIEEAILERYYTEKREAERQMQEQQEAQQKAQAGLQEYMQGRQLQG